MHSKERYLSLLGWAQKMSVELSAIGELKLPAEPLLVDASTRHFFRAETAHGSIILVDAPPSTENNIQFARLGPWYAAHGFNVPIIYAMDLEAGFFLISDLGRQTYLDVLQQHPAQAKTLYRTAMSALLKLADADPEGIPDYSEQRFRDELALFGQWCIEAWLDLTLPVSWHELSGQLLAAVMEQPKVCVHRDFHSRNLMVLDADAQLDATNPGIVDYQDTLVGPVTYDITSLLWDCYIDWPQNLCLERLEWFRQQHAQRGNEYPFECFYRWARCTASQRHLKALGIFARLYVQDGRKDYLATMPRVLAYLEQHLAVVNQEFASWLQTTLCPEIKKRLSMPAVS